MATMRQNDYSPDEVLSVLQDVPDENLNIGASEFRLRHGWINMTVVYSRLGVFEVLRRSVAENPRITYKELMEHCGSFVISAKRRAGRGDDELKDFLKSIFRETLANSLKRIVGENDGTPISFMQARHNFPGLEKAASFAYSRCNGKTPWRQLVEDSGYDYEFDTHRKWSTRELLASVSSRGNSPNDFDVRQMRKEDQGLQGSIEHRFGNFGKAAILLGIDFPSKPRKGSPKKSSYVFSSEDFALITEDDSIYPSDKIRYIFNAIALQDYSEFRGRKRINKNRRVLDGSRNGFVLEESYPYFGGIIESVRGFYREDWYIVGLDLNRLDNPIRSTRFNFRGEMAATQSFEFYEKLRDTLSHIKVKARRIQNDCCPHDQK